MTPTPTVSVTHLRAHLKDVLEDVQDGGEVLVGARRVPQARLVSAAAPCLTGETVTIAARLAVDTIAYEAAERWARQQSPLLDRDHLVLLSALHDTLPPHAYRHLADALVTGIAAALPDGSWAPAPEHVHAALPYPPEPANDDQ